MRQSDKFAPGLGTSLTVFGRSVSSCATTPFSLTANAHADPFAHLVDVMVRPGDDFASPDAAMRYEQGICAKVSQSRVRRDVDDSKVDFGAADHTRAATWGERMN